MSVGLLLGAVCLLFVPPLFREGPLLQTDQPQWAAVAQIWLSDVLPDQGWTLTPVTDRLGAGMVATGAYSTTHWLLTALAMAVGPFTAVKLAMLVSAAMFCLALFWVARLHMSSPYALLAALLALSACFDNLVSGMWYNYLSLGFALSFWGVSDKFLNKGSRLGLLVAVAIIAAAVFTHPVGAVLACTVWAAHLVALGRRMWQSSRRCVVAYGLVLPAGLLLAAPQLLATTATGLEFEMGLGATAAGFTPFIEAIRRLTALRVWGAIPVTPMITLLFAVQVVAAAVLCVLGIIGAGRLKLFRLRWTIAVIVVVNAALVGRLYNILPEGVLAGVRAALDMQYSRFQILSQVYLALLSAVGLAWVLGTNAVKAQRVARKLVFGGLLFPIALMALQPFSKVFIFDTGQLATLSESPLRHDLLRFWNWVSEHVDPDSSRICFPDIYDELRWYSGAGSEGARSHAFALTSALTGVRQVGGTSFSSRFEAAHGPGGPLWKSGSGDPDLRRELAWLNCHHVVAVDTAARMRFYNSTLLRPVFESESFTAFSADLGTPRWAWNLRSGETAVLEFIGSHRATLRTAGAAGDSVFVSIAYHPGWSAFTGGRPFKLHDFNLFLLVELAQPGLQTIDLTFSTRSSARPILQLAGLLSLLLGVRLLPARERLPRDHVRPSSRAS